MYYILWLLPFLVGCQYLPQVAKNIEEIATDTAILIEVSKETFQKDTDLDICIKVQNKEEPAPIPGPSK